MCYGSFPCGYYGKIHIFQFWVNLEYFHRNLVYIESDSPFLSEICFRAEVLSIDLFEVVYILECSQINMMGLLVNLLADYQLVMSNILPQALCVFGYSLH